MTARPIVGVPADRRRIDPHHFHIVGEKYLDAVIDGAGGLQLIVPVLADRVDGNGLLDGVDGILLTGSPSNVEPHHYGGVPARQGTLADSHRDGMTLPLARAALDRGVPLFAICRGFQELNVALGGTLHQHVHEVAGFDDHREDTDAPVGEQYGPAHRVVLTTDGMLHRLHGDSTAVVNSLHGQGVDKLADGVTVEAVAGDGLVEAFTVDDATAFALAVQWHPEWRVTENRLSLRMFGAFGDACRQRMAERAFERRQGAAGAIRESLPGMDA